MDSQIPVKPDRTRRINLAVDCDVYARAMSVRLDIHQLLKHRLLEAVEALERRTMHGTDSDEDRNPFFASNETEGQTLSADGVVRIRDRQCPRSPPDAESKISARIENSAENARRKLAGTVNLERSDL
jgi:hypothetical protein